MATTAFFTRGVRTVEVLVFAPHQPVALAVFAPRGGHRSVPTFPLVAGLIRPAGTSGDGDELLRAVGEIQLVDGGGFFGVIETVGFYVFIIEDIRPGDAAVRAEHHYGFGPAVALGESGKDVAVVQQHTVGMSLIRSAAVSAEITVIGGEGILGVEISVLARRPFGHRGKIHKSAVADRQFIDVGVGVGVGGRGGFFLVARDQRNGQRQHEDERYDYQFLFHVILLARAAGRRPAKTV